MAKSNLLTAAFCRNTKESKLHPDGNGLFLSVSPTGSKSWLLRLRWNGKRPEIGLGSFADVTLADARELAGDVRKLARQGTDPRQWRAIQDAERQGRKSSALTFDECIEPVMKIISAEMRNPKHVAQWESTLKTYATPIIGSMPVDRIEVEHVHEVLAPIWISKTETASRLRGRIERVLSWAIVNRHRKPPNPATWRGNLEVLLPKPNKARKPGHFAALPYAALPDFMAALRAHDSTSAKALQLAILTTARTQEITQARWQEFDMVRKVWTVPADRMKAHREHRVPLTPAMLRLLKSIPKIEDSPFVFPGMKGNPHLSNMAMLQFLKRIMQRPDLTVHGFRSTFKDWAVEETSFPAELSEAQLAHVITDKTQAAYERGDKFKKRRALLSAWCAYCGY